MQTFEALRQAIDTTEDLQSIVRTMKVLSAVSIRQYERAVKSLENYEGAVHLGLGVVMKNYRPLSPPAGRSSKARMGVIVFGSDHGLCGRFNESIINFTLQTLRTFTASPRILVVGARAAAAIGRYDLPVEEDYFGPGSVTGIKQTVRQLLLNIDAWRSTDVHDVLMFFNVHQTGATHQPEKLHLLPMDITRFTDYGKKSWSSRSLPTYTMEGETLFSALVRQYLFISLFRACVESLASEHASRLMSMQIAEKNIRDRLADLSGRFREQRQNAITEELLDVVAGFEALQDETKAGESS